MPRSRRADGFPAPHLVEYAAALRALDGVRCQAHQLVRLNLVTAKWARLREVEMGLSFEPWRHHPTRPSAERTGFRINPTARRISQALDVTPEGLS
jgi:hypothetical protein